MTKLFLDGQIFMGSDANPGGMTALQIIWEAAEAANPIYYNDSVVHLFCKPSREAMRAMADSIKQVTKVALERMDVEFDVSRPEVAFTLFDLGRWADASALLRDGTVDNMKQLLRHARDAFRMWQLPWKQGVEELQSCAALLLGDEADRRSRGIVLDNRIVWARVQEESFNRRLSSKLQVLPKLVSIYLCCVDGTGQVERDFGSLKKIVDVHSGPLNEDGDTASWLVEIFADGPKSEEEVATRLECSGRSPVSVPSCGSPSMVAA